MTEESKGKKYLSQILDKVVVQLIWTIIVAIITGGITYVISKKLLFTPLEITLFVVIIVLLIGIGSYLIYRRINRRIPVFNTVDCNFQLLREERVHKWISETEYIHKRRYMLKALTTGVTCYTDKFQWTGGNYKLSGGNDDYKVELIEGTKNIFDLYNFVFTKPLMKGEIIELEATWKAEGNAKPFFSTTIEEPTDLLILSVMLYPESKVKEVNCEIGSYKGAQFPNKIEKQKLNSDGEYTWTVKNPKILHHYEINWKKI